jgi:hypothetical protein
MMMQYLVAQHGAVDMRVYLGRRDALVPKHTLYDSQVGTAFEQMSGERVAEGVRD